MSRILYPLTQSQEIMYLNLKFSFGRKQIVNICATAHFDGSIDKDLMMKAIKAAYEGNKSTHIRLTKEGKAIKQYFVEKEVCDLPYLDFSNKTQAEYDAAITQFSQTPFPNSSLETPLYALKFLKKPDGQYALFSCVNHIGFDTYSLMGMASEFLDIYVCLKKGEPIPESKVDPIPMILQEQTYVNSDKIKQDIDYWDRSEYGYGTEPLFCGINGAGYYDVKGKRYGRHLKLFKTKGAQENHTIPAATAQKVLDLAADLKVSPQSIYLLAHRAYLSKVNDNRDDVYADILVARRATLIEKRGYGTRVHPIPARMHFPQTVKVRDAAAKTYDIQLQGFAHANLGAVPLMAIYQKKYGVPQMHGYQDTRLSIQPYFIQVPEEVPIHLTIHGNGACAQVFFLTIIALDSSGDLTCNYEHGVSLIKKGVIADYHAFMLRALEAMAANPDMTLQELNEV